jgi:hypothetical protein
MLLLHCAEIRHPNTLAPGGQLVDEARVSTQSEIVDRFFASVQAASAIAYNLEKFVDRPYLKCDNRGSNL